MFLQHLKVSGLLSFGVDGIDLRMEPLNVLIGPNGAGKSNLLEVLALLRAAPTGLPAPVRAVGGIREWLWKGEGSRRVATIEASVAPPSENWLAAWFTDARPSQAHRRMRRSLERCSGILHALEVTEHGSRLEVLDERIENADPASETESADYYYRFQRGRPSIAGEGVRRDFSRARVSPDESILSQVRDPELYPVLNWLQEQYGDIRLYRNWQFGPAAQWRFEQSAHARSDVLSDGGENLIPVLLNLVPRVRNEFLDALRELFDGIDDVSFGLGGGNVQMFLHEHGREIPASRLSDGTLRYLALLAILLHPDPPPLVGIEEPELGLHPDVVPVLADLLVRASVRTQLVVTTHSRMLVDALSQQPSRVVVCEQTDGESRFRRLPAEELRPWLDDYSLGALWSMGELGGNRW